VGHIETLRSSMLAGERLTAAIITRGSWRPTGGMFNADFSLRN
jgi:hypothetical protein